MRPEELEFILSPRGRAVLDELSAEPLSPDTLLATATRLRERLEPGPATVALEMALLRRRAARKFSRADRMFFTRAGLEQATAEAVATHRARRFATAKIDRVADMGCGIGGDALALAATGVEVTAIDREWVHAALARENAAAYDVGARVLPVVADLTEMPPLAVGAFFFDPARRTATGPRLAPGRRLRSVEAYRPPLSLIDVWRPRVPSGAVKVSPGIDYAELPPDAEAEFVSYDGEVREAVLWFGGLRTSAARRATLLPGGDTLTDLDPSLTVVGPPRTYLYEPDGAVIRAHLVGQVAHLLQAALIDPEIAYLTVDNPAATPFARGYYLEDHFPFQLKRLRTYLRERGVGAVTIKKRGSPLDVDVLRQALRLRGSNHRTLFLTQVMGRATVLVGELLGN
jgi:SAM-dependent methyltransferase